MSFFSSPILRCTRLAAAAALAILGVAAGLGAAPALAQSWPARPIKMIAPYPPGGGVDTVSRLFAERLSARLGQPVTVENMPGAGATIGAAALAKSAPDGYTLMMGSVVDYSIAPHVHKNLSFDMRRDFVPIVEVANGTVVLVVNADFPPKTVAELIALAKSKPGQFSFASSGIGGLQHLNAEMFKQMAGVDLVHVPYKGTAQFLPDLLAGRVPMSIDSLPAHLPHIRAGKLRVLAVASRARAPMLPDVPTMSEAGLTGYESATNYTLFAPAGTPREAIDRVNRETNAVLQTAEVRDRLLALGIVTAGSTVEAATAKAGAEMTKWAGVIKAAQIKFD
ncbi:MAG: tripartite tricarboxylate transporter substrate binding protein [Burkholderiales bacterium]|nr:tripartite tricarboxylate transporter substrate binding protein [Burkholderiales bacterium]